MRKNMKEIEKAIKEISEQGRFLKEKEAFQHGDTTVFEHSVHVAYTSLEIARALHLDIDETSLIRGALLHDYFLYDWHTPHDGHEMHGFTHPYRALKNAKEDFDLNKIEENIIVRHMFPLTPIPPKYMEAWIVCLADKYAASKETYNGILLKMKQVVKA